MRVLAVLALAVLPAPCLAAAFPFVPPTGFKQVISHEIDYSISPFVYNSKSQEYVVAEAFPTVTTQAELVRAMHAIRQQFRDLPAQIGKLDQQARVCGAPGVHGAYAYAEGKQRWAIEHWEFISGGTGYSVAYVRPSKIPRNAAVARKLQNFCPGDESEMERLNLQGFEIDGEPRRYHLAGDWESPTLGGGIHEIVYPYGTGLDSDPSLSAHWLERGGFRLQSSLYVSHCGSPLQQEAFSYGPSDAGIIIEREFATVSNRTSVLTYTRDSNLPAAPAAEKTLKTFCVPRAPLVDFSGKWGGAGAEVVVDARSAAFWANCAQGAMLVHGANLDSPDGRTFDLPARISPDRASARSVTPVQSPSGICRFESPA